MTDRQWAILWCARRLPLVPLFGVGFLPPLPPVTNPPVRRPRLRLVTQPADAGTLSAQPPPT
jgi:hypothetical protein